MTNQNPKLLPCPFCGGTETRQKRAGSDDECSFTQCVKCEAGGPTQFPRQDDEQPDWNTRPAKAEDNKGKGDIDADGLHSKIDMDIEDQLGRDITLEESKIIGLAIRATLSTLARPQEIDVEQLKDELDRILVEENNDGTIMGIKNKRRGVFETIDHLFTSGYLSAPYGKKG